MQLNVVEKGLIIKPENFQDKAFIENALGLKSDGDSIILRRENLKEWNLTGVTETNYILMAKGKINESSSKDHVNHGRRGRVQTSPPQGASD